MSKRKLLNKNLNLFMIGVLKIVKYYLSFNLCLYKR